VVSHDYEIDPLRSVKWRRKRENTISPVGDSRPSLPKCPAPALPRNRNVVSNVANEEMLNLQNRAAFPLERHSVSPALRAGRMDRPGRPQGDNDIVEQYKNPSKELAP
jgi:hypothetical protein